MSVINTNTLSLVTQNNLTKSQGALNTAIERLSSGMRINSAKDDAAGQAIANRFTASIKGLTQASRNANDGISMAQTTEGALNEINTSLQRIRELTVQSANEANSPADKAVMQAEITQRMAEIDRTSAQTEFNGVKVLSSSAKELSVQVGANDGETIKIGLSEISSKTLGLTGFNVDGTGANNQGASINDLQTAGFKNTTLAPLVYTKTFGAGDAASASDVLGKIENEGTVTIGTSEYTYSAATKSYTGTTTAIAANAVKDSLLPAAGKSVTATVTQATSQMDVKIDSNGALTSAADGSALFVDSAGKLSATNVGGAMVAATVDSLADVMALGASIKVGSTGATYTSDGSVFTLSDEPASADAVAAKVAKATANGIPAAIDLDGGGTSYAVSAAGAVTLASKAVYLEVNGDLTDSATQVLDLAANGDVTDATDNKVYADAAHPGKLTTKASSSGVTADPLKALDAALKKVDDLRGSLGAVQNRFDSVIANLGTTIVNLTSSRSRIEDADYATEVSNMTRAQILQQAGTSVLAKSNSSTEGVMSLLR